MTQGNSSIYLKAFPFPGSLFSLDRWNGFYDRHPLPDLFRVFYLGKWVGIRFFHQFINIGFRKILFLFYEKIAVLIAVAYQPFFRVGNLTSPIKSEVYIFAGPPYGNGAKCMAEFFRRRPAKCQRIIVIVNQLIGLRVRLPTQIAVTIAPVRSALHQRAAKKSKDLLSGLYSFLLM